MPKLSEVMAQQPTAPLGQVAAGNIDLNARPIVKNPDGSISTVRSISIGVDGKEVLIPTVSDDGRIMSNDEAIDTFRRTGRNLGAFDSVANADAYAKSLHDQQAVEYLPKVSPTAPKRIKLSELTGASAAPVSANAAHPDDVPYASGASPYTSADLMPAAMAPEREVTAGDWARALGRDAAMQGGSLLKGAAALPDLVLAPATAVVNRGLDAAGIDPSYHQVTVREALDRGLKAAGVPEASTGTERFANRVVEGLGSIGAGGIAGGALASAESVPAKVAGKALSENLGQQTAALTAGNTFGGVAHEMGAPAGVELAASLAGSLAPATAGATMEGLTRVSRRAIGAPDADTISLAEKAQAMGIPLKASQIGDAGAAKAVDAVTKNAPFSGGRAFEEAQKRAFNRAVSQTIGEDAEKITSQVFDRARKRIGSEFDRLTESGGLPLTPELSKSIQGVLANAQPFGQEATNTIRAVVGDLVKRSEGGMLSGRAFQSIDSNLGKAIAAGGERSVYLADLQEALRDAMGKNLSPEDAAAWANARAQYRDLKTIEPLISDQGLVSGNVSPAKLMGRVNANKSGKASMARGGRGDLGDLAAIGQRFVKETVGNSGTAPRLAVMEAMRSAAPTLGLAGAATGLGNLYGVGNAALAGLSALGTSRLAQRINQNPELVGQLLGRGNGLTSLSRGVQTSTQPGLVSLVGNFQGQ